MKPVDIEFVLRGNLKQEVDKVRMSVKTFGAEGARAYASVLEASNRAFQSMSTEAQTQSVALQKVIVSLKRTEDAQTGLKERFDAGKMSASQYAQASARLAVQQSQLKGTAAELNASLQREIAINAQVKGSYNERVATLKQLKETYAQLSEEEINNAQVGGKMLHKIQELEAANKKFEESLKGVAATQSTSINGMKSKLTQLEQKYNSLSKAERNNKNVGGRLSNQMRKLKRDIASAEASNQTFLESLKNAPGAFGATVSGIEQMTRAAMRFIATPLGAIIAALVVAFKALTVWFHRGSAGESAFAKVSGYFSQILNTILNIASKVGEWLYKAFTDPKKAIKDIGNFIESQILNRLKAFSVMGKALEEIFTGNFKKGFKDLANGTVQLSTGITNALDKTQKFVKDVNAGAEQMGKINAALYKQERDNVNVGLQALKLKEKIAKLRITAMDYYGGADKVAASKKAVEDIIVLVKKKADLEITAAQNTYDLTQKKYFLENGVTSIKDLNIEQQKKLVELEKNVVQKRAEADNLLRRMQGNMNSIIAREHAIKDAVQQTTNELKLKKKAYESYYEYLTVMGKDAANQMFKELLTGGASYLDYLNRQIAALQAKKNRSKDDNSRLVVYTNERNKVSGAKTPIQQFKDEIAQKKKLYSEDVVAFQKYLQEKKKALTGKDELTTKERVIVDFELESSKTSYQKKLNDLLQKYSGYTTRAASLTKSYKLDKAILEKAGTDEAKAALVKLNAAYKAALSELNNANSGYLQQLFSDISRMGNRSLNRLMTETRNALSTAKSKTMNGQTFITMDVASMDKNGQEVRKQVTMTLEEFQKFQKRYDELFKASVNRNPFKGIADGFKDINKASKNGDIDNLKKGFDETSQSLSTLSDFLSSVGQSLGDIFGKDTADDVQFLSDLAQGAGQAAKGVGELASGDIVNGIKDTLAGVAKLFKTLTKGAKEYRDAQAKYLEEMIQLQLKLNDAIFQQTLAQQTGNIFINDYVGQIRQAYLAMTQAQLNFDKLLKGDSLEQYLSQFTVKIGVAKKKFLGITIGKKDVFGSILDQYPNLIDDQGNLNEAVAKTILTMKGLPTETKDALNALIQYQDEMKAATDQINSAISSMAGSISTDLYNALSDAWKHGSDSFKAFQDSVSKGMESMISQMVYNQIFAGAFQKLQDNLKASFNPTSGDQSAMDDFQKFLGQAPELLGKWNAAMGDLQTSLEEAGLSVAGLMDDMTGTTADSIASSIAQGFQNGYRSAADFANNFKDLMKQAVLESLKVQVLQKPLQAWYEQFQSTMANGTLSQNMEALNKQFNNIIAQAGDYIKGIEQATGLDFGVSQSTQASGIKSITEDTASKLEGNFIAVRVNTAQIAETAQGMLRQMAVNQLHLLNIERNTNELARLEKIEIVLTRLETDGIKIK